MIPRILGVDPSLTSTGLAYADGTATIDGTEREGTHRLRWIRDMVLHFASYPEPVDLVVVEGVALGARGTDAAEGFGLAWVLRVALADEGIGYVEIPPTVLKVYALGKGRGKGTDKVAMGVAAYKRAGLEFPTDDECDAYFLRAMALHHYTGSPIADIPSSHWRALNSITWPVLPAFEPSGVGR